MSIRGALLKSLQRITTSRVYGRYSVDMVLELLPSFLTYIGLGLLETLLYLTQLLIDLYPCLFQRHISSFPFLLSKCFGYRFRVAVFRYILAKCAKKITLLLNEVGFGHVKPPG